MAANRIHLVAMILALLTFMLLVIALTANRWVDLVQSYSGLWKFCFNTLIGVSCVTYGGDISDHIHVTRAFLVLAAICSAVAVIALAFAFFRAEVGNFPLVKVSAVAHIIAAIFALIALATFTGVEVPNQFFGWTFGLGWACVPLCVISAVLAYKTPPS